MSRKMCFALRDRVDLGWQTRKLMMQSRFLARGPVDLTVQGIVCDLQPAIDDKNHLPRLAGCPTRYTTSKQRRQLCHQGRTLVLEIAPSGYLSLTPSMVEDIIQLVGTVPIVLRT